MWALRFKKDAEKAIAAMHPQMRRRVTVALEELAADPHAAKHVKPLKGQSGLMRLRVGEWRVIYRPIADELVVLIVEIGPRGGIY